MFFKKASQSQQNEPQETSEMTQKTVPLITPPDMGRCLQELERIFNLPKAKGALLLLYLENFKQFNDTFGYARGERFLHELFLFLNELEGAQVMRCNGAEFLVILKGQSFAQANSVAQMIQARFEETWHIDEMDYMCSMSLGMLLYPEVSERPADIIRCLEYAMSEASGRGQNSLAVFNSDLRQKLQRRNQIALLLPETLKSGNVEVRYRPTIRTGDGIFCRAECYMRMNMPGLGAVGASEFTPVAEDSGQICAVGWYALEQVCRDIRRLMDADVKFESLSVPVSPVLLLQESFFNQMIELLERYEIPPRRLALELCESALLTSTNRVVISMQELSEMGVEIILNEFGTGYSGINNILALPVDVLKLERLFIWQLENDIPRSGALIAGLINIAREMNLKLIAEGVETQTQVDFLKQCGCAYEQGFYYSTTVTIAGLEALLGRGVEAVSPELTDLV